MESEPGATPLLWLEYCEAHPNGYKYSRVPCPLPAHHTLIANCRLAAYDEHEAAKLEIWRVAHWASLLGVAFVWLRVDLLFIAKWVGEHNARGGLHSPR